MLAKFEALLADYQKRNHFWIRQAPGEDSLAQVKHELCTSFNDIARDFIRREGREVQPSLKDLTHLINLGISLKKFYPFTILAAFHGKPFHELHAFLEKNMPKPEPSIPSFLDDFLIPLSNDPFFAERLPEFLDRTSYYDGSSFIKNLWTQRDFCKLGIEPCTLEALAIFLQKKCLKSQYRELAKFFFTTKQADHLSLLLAHDALMPPITLTSAFFETFFIPQYDFIPGFLTGHPYFKTLLEKGIFQKASFGKIAAQLIKNNDPIQLNQLLVYDQANLPAVLLSDLFVESASSTSEQWIAYAAKEHCWSLLNHLMQYYSYLFDQPVVKSNIAYFWIQGGQAALKPFLFLDDSPLPRFTNEVLQKAFDANRIDFILAYVDTLAASHPQINFIYQQALLTQQPEIVKKLLDKYGYKTLDAGLSREDCQAAFIKLIATAAAQGNSSLADALSRHYFHDDGRRPVIHALTAPEDASHTSSCLSEIEKRSGFPEGQEDFEKQHAYYVNKLCAILQCEVFSIEAHLPLLGQWRKNINKTHGARVDIERFGEIRTDGLITPINMGTPYYQYLSRLIEAIQANSRAYPSLRCGIHDGEPAVQGTITASLNGEELRVTSYMRGVWYHTDFAVVAKILPHLETLIQRAVAKQPSAGQNKEVFLNDLVQDIAEIHWWWSQATPYQRGSPSCAKFLIEAVFKLKGYYVTGWNTEADCEAFICPGIKQYQSQYRSFMKGLEPIEVSELRASLVWMPGSDDAGAAPPCPSH